MPVRGRHLEKGEARENRFFKVDSNLFIHIHVSSSFSLLSNGVYCALWLLSYNSDSSKNGCLSFGDLIN